MRLKFLLKVRPLGQEEDTWLPDADGLQLDLQLGMNYVSFFVRCYISLPFFSFSSYLLTHSLLDILYLNAKSSQPQHFTWSAYLSLSVIWPLKNPLIDLLYPHGCSYLLHLPGLGPGIAGAIPACIEPMYCTSSVYVN